MTNKQLIIEAFRRVKALGWVESHRSNNTGIGKTFEDCIGVVENNFNEPDLFGFEIKAHREESASYVTLFTKSPSFPKKGANAYLSGKYGECYPNSEIKKLHTSIFADSYNSYMNKYSFRLIHRPDEGKIYVGVFTSGGEKELDCSVYYTYSDIEAALENKLHSLLYVRAKRKNNESGTELFYYDSAVIYSSPSLDKFLSMLDDGKIMYDIRIGACMSGKKYGKPHDHGSGFRIREHDLCNLYSCREEIE